MRRVDDVFFFTLIDFLVQVFFFGLLLFVVGQAARQEEASQREIEVVEVEKLKSATGVSSLTELTDYLTKLAPVKELKGMSDFISSAGGVDKAKAAIKVVTDAGGAENASVAVRVVAEAGGPESLQGRLEKLRKLEEGSGKPPCLFDLQSDGKRVARSLAKVNVTDAQISFLGSTQDLEAVLKMIGASYHDVENLSLVDFRKRFSALVVQKPECRYQLDVQVSTKLLAPMDAVWSAFATRRR